MNVPPAAMVGYLRMQLTVRDAASLLSVSEKTVYRWIAQQSIPFYLVNRQYRFNRAELLEWATSRRIQVSDALLAEPESAATAMPSLAEAIDAGGIIYRVGGPDKESVLRGVVEQMRLPDEVDRAFLLRVLLARERLAPTSVGDGIAIPHVRNPVVLHVARPTITLCFLEQAVDFAALDGLPVRVVFALLSPTTRAHLWLMSRLGFALRDGGFRDAVLRVASRDEIMTEVRRLERSFAGSMAGVGAVAPGGTTGAAV